MKSLEAKIRAVEDRIRPLQLELGQLERQRNALNVLRSVAPDRHRKEQLTHSHSGADGADHTPCAAYRHPRLHVLFDLGGKADSETALLRLRDHMSSMLRARDLEDVPSESEERWRIEIYPLRIQRICAPAP